MWVFTCVYFCLQIAKGSDTDKILRNLLESRRDSKIPVLIPEIPAYHIRQQISCECKYTEKCRILQEDSYKL